MAIGLLEVIENLLGHGKRQGSKGDYLFYCPACNHRKPKLSVNIDHSSRNFGSWACWVCQDTNGTKGRKLWQLFKKFNASKEQFNELKEALGDIDYSYVPTEEKIKKFVSLPKEYIPIWKENKSFIRKHALLYLEKRGITLNDMLKYSIGYCEEGRYSNRIIIPSYDKDGRLNYFTGRKFYGQSPLKYLNPDISKDIIGFELFINWNMPVVLTEGVFDAIAIKRNVIPLFGKTLSDSLYKELVTHKPIVYVCLDEDAIKQAIYITERLLNEGIEVYLVNLKGEDPSDIGFNKMINIIQSHSIHFDMSKLLKYKITYNVA